MPPITHRRLPYDIALSHQHHPSVIVNIRTLRNQDRTLRHRAKMLTICFTFVEQSNFILRPPSRSSYDTSHVIQHSVVRAITFPSTFVTIISNSPYRMNDIRVGVTTFIGIEGWEGGSGMFRVAERKMSAIVTLIPLDLRRPRHPSTSPLPLEDPQYETRSLKKRIEVISSHPPFVSLPPPPLSPDTLAAPPSLLSPPPSLTSHIKNTRVPVRTREREAVDRSREV
ncbi:hypothetical protein SISNIDRAFT_464634 [Sistotremastrum niveocremeum HHB9708]|uniref:Uncharacterized protein n=1 Tax=Sistotremastrum niveocremeum HHB9708 TaxID=1314777 RepID=A0A164X509_9AGAM|nr:hypothetical protein SISNIDRAFT_464634 [Sistotremastrum niveocremeum HHB9708]